ncbi:hypothetical protein THAOC_10720 [Thalassiosira oceanica]|uniref:TATA element modulatory factor 1 TATA binding domain-containing protein n=1 Tax=Thalassiosira oceanica TaxID=159749 RepID=K0T458_THAOC|nr:hypothetical protein THAOC_10720 [Thalassiosira oceanica]|mmetsp:Transcript_35258/g.84231  ORF Transcript_35258/g.84231 Transcript_35258/m.84231 type:complete len:936 (-) Transcript_35258:64-2871(-)|eukprot:EJK68131.1 hypothetical protein THAOC_10720 [Thalassiosira oceanica]
MWNLSALAAKAQEAAARIERQLDESTGLKQDDGAPESQAQTVAHEDFNDDDDFFSEDAPPLPAASTDPSVSSGWEQDDIALDQVDEEEDMADLQTSSSPSSETAKLGVAAGGGHSFVGDEAAGAMTATIQPSHATSTEHQVSEEIDFGVDDAGVGGIDGWDGTDDLPFDDEEEREDEQRQATEAAQNLGTTPATASINEQVRVRVDKTNDDESFHVNPGTEASNPEVPSEYFQSTSTASLCPEGEQEEPKIAEGSSVQEPVVDEAVAPTNERLHSEPPLPDINLVNESTGVPSDQNLPSPSVERIPIYMDGTEKQQYLQTISELESRLHQREEQLASKSDQIASLSMQHEAETAQLRKAISETKDEAKKRIIRSKERVEEMQKKLADATKRADAAGGSSEEQSDIIAALRAEGEKLARKQSQMEQAVRNASSESRNLQELLDAEKVARGKEVAKVALFEQEVKALKGDLASARKGENQSKKLEQELCSAKEESEKQRASNLGLDQQLKELKDENKALKKEVEEARTGAALELEGESNKLRKERDEMLSDLESKLRTSEREANVREDALRHEVSELRKRWQDAVRRAEDLSMDVQQSTAPLLRQLESTERQNRTRSAAWAELETKLRSELEDNITQVDKLTKERNDLLSSEKRNRRILKEKEEEIASSQETIDALTATIESQESKVDELEEELRKMKDETTRLERRASEGAAKVRSEMMQTVVDSEQRYRSDIESLEEQLEVERRRRTDIEKQLDDLADSVAAAEFAQQENRSQAISPAKAKELVEATDQASILQDTLGGIDSDEEDGEENKLGVERHGSFAAMEQLSLGLKGAKIELEALRKQLASSEETRESLVEELGEARQAVEKLPLFEQKVSELTMEINLKDMEIKGLQDDIADVRFLYRTQLDALLEEKMSGPQQPQPCGEQAVIAIDSS